MIKHSACFVNVDILEAVSRRYFLKKVFLEILQNSQENVCARASFLIEIFEFPVSFAKFLRTPFLREHLRWLLLIFVHRL